MTQFTDSGEADAELSMVERVSDERALIAPWWHTLLVVTLILGLSISGAWRMNHFGNRPLMLTPNYLLTIAYEWILAGLALWGISMRGIGLKQLLGEWKPDARGWIADIGVAFLFWLAALMLLSVLGQGIRYALGATVDPSKIADITQKLAPTTGVEMVLFLVLSISAGICEELVFRGYLQQQCARASGRTWIGVAIAALIFGCAHGYEGVAGVLLITAYGAMFGVLAIYRRGLRTGMIAHAWHDSASGIALVLLRHYGFHLGMK